MNLKRLSKLIERPDVHQMILGDYEGGYSLGITSHPDNPDEFAIRVRIEGDDASRIPSQVLIGGESVPVLVHTNFKVPVPLTRR